MVTSTTWQLGLEAAERYEQILTPVILGPFAEALVTFAALQEGEYVVDVGCGTGAAARYAAEYVAKSGAVTGVDLNPGMIEVARTAAVALPHPIDWRVADATQLPLADESIDTMLCAQSLQFMRDKAPLALGEMVRVLKPEGRVAISLWGPLETNPYFYELVRVIAHNINAATAAGLQAAFALADSTAVVEQLQEAGLRSIKITSARLELPLPDLVEWIPHHISATPMATGFFQAAPAVQQAIVEEVITALDPYCRNNCVVVPFQSHMILAHK